MNEADLMILFKEYSDFVWMRFEFLVSISMAVIIASYAVRAHLQKSAFVFAMLIYSMAHLTLSAVIISNAERSYAIYESIAQVGAISETQLPIIQLMIARYESSSDLLGVFYGVLILLWAGTVGFALLQRRAIVD